ncbi:MAG: hypothetical protein SFV81_07050 [Pirellulaceae bacterium]|nr:hypothetical protein [Pirellulaceae bacterium]
MIVWQNLIRRMPMPFLTFVSVSMLLAIIVGSYLLREPTPTPSLHTNRENVTQSAGAIQQSSYEGAQPRTNAKPEIASNPLADLRQELHAEFELKSGRIKQLRSDLASISEELKRLQDDEDGKKIAGSEENFQRLVGLMRYMASLEETASVCESQYSRLVAEEVGATKLTGLQGTRKSLAATDSQLASLADDVSNVRLSLRAVLSVCQNLSPAAKTIRQRIAAIEVDSKLDFAQKLKDNQDAAAIKQREEIANAEREKADAAAKLQAAKIELEAAKIRVAESDASSALLKNDAEKERAAEKAKLEAEFQRELPQIRSSLALLLASGKSQPEHAGYQNTVEFAGPMSLKALQGCGALQEGEAGLKNLGFAMTYGNDRYKYSVPQYIGGALTKEHLSYLEPASRFLRKYQYLLVEKKMLAE